MLIVGDMEGCVVGLTDIVGFIDIDGETVGDQLGADDTVGLRLMEGLCVGELRIYERIKCI